MSILFPSNKKKNLELIKTKQDQEKKDKKVKKRQEETKEKIEKDLENLKLKLLTKEKNTEKILEKCTKSSKPDNCIN
mgnify:CR=1 FL=1